MDRVNGAASSRRAGLTLLEVVVVGAVLVVGGLGFMSVFGAASAVGRSTREAEVAVRAAARVMESLEAYVPQADVVAVHNDDPDDDPAGSVPIEGIDGSRFPVAGLQPAPGDADGVVGEIIFPIDPYTGDERTDIDSLDVDLVRDYVARMTFGEDVAELELVPVIVRIEWDAGGVVRQHQVVGVLAP